LIATQNAENGRTEFVYRRDGKIRFSRNALQGSQGSYSYTNYDRYGRLVESGEYFPGGSGLQFNSDLTATPNAMRDILEDVSSTGGLTTGTKKDVGVTVYDVADNTLSSSVSGYTQDAFYLGGAVSYTQKYSSIVDNSPNSSDVVSAAWFNYDEEGKLLWQVKYIKGLGYKTTDYSYDQNNLLTERIYQKDNSTEYFAHKYEYDPANLNLWKTYTRTGSADTWKLQAKYSYYLHGPLKRVELAEDLQGVDYVYTVEGFLKAINNSNKDKDPGMDGISGANASFQRDAFGMVLDHYTNDYVCRSGYAQAVRNVVGGSYASDSYIGNIKAMSWYSKKPVTVPAISEDPTTYLYQYDRYNQLTEATFGTDLNFVNNPATYTATTYNKEKIKNPTTGASAYDYHGNIQYLERTDGAGNVTEKFQYNYTANTNKLASITNTASGSPVTYASYTYDALGQLTIEDTQDPAQKKYIRYDVTGKVTAVARDAAFTEMVVEYVYDELGQRIMKKTYNSSHHLIQNTYYVGDVIYTQPVVNDIPGIAVVQEYGIDGGGGRIGIYYRQSGIYAYQLTDHLGNVRAVVAKNSGTLEVRLYNDYYPFGTTITPGTTGTNDYRYGYQGQYAEKDPETDWNAFELRMYDSRIARWLTIDPADEYWSPYAAMGNNPLSITDPTGGEGCDDCPDSKTLSEIIIRSTPRKTFNWLGLPKGMSKEVYNNNVNYSALIRDRHANGEPLLQDNDPDSYRNDFARYERSYQANQEWRQMNYNLLEFASVWVPMPKLAVLKWLRYEGTTAKGGQTIIGEGMKRVSMEAAKREGSVILNNMPKFTGTADQVTSQMMTYNRQWILQQMRSGRPILDIGLDATRANPSIFYQMEQNMMRNYLKLHPNAFQVIKP